MNICEQDKDNVALFNVNLNLHMYTLAQQILKTMAINNIYKNCNTFQ